MICSVVVTPKSPLKHTTAPTKPTQVRLRLHSLWVCSLLLTGVSSLTQCFVTIRRKLCLNHQMNERRRCGDGVAARKDVRMVVVVLMMTLLSLILVS